LSAKKQSECERESEEAGFEIGSEVVISSLVRRYSNY